MGGQTLVVGDRPIHCSNDIEWSSGLLKLLDSGIHSALNRGIGYWHVCSPGSSPFLSFRARYILRSGPHNASSKSFSPPPTLAKLLRFRIPLHLSPCPPSLEPRLRLESRLAAVPRSVVYLEACSLLQVTRGRHGPRKRNTAP